MHIRHATLDDRDRILEISAQIWEGDDYIHWVIDDWYGDANGEFVVAEICGRVDAFSFRSWLFPGYAWLQGIRTDPACQGRGIGRAITEHFLEGAREDGADRVGLSTFIDNKASIHIIESYGFRRIASYIYGESPKEGALRAPQIGRNAPPRTETIGGDEAAAFLRSSAFLTVCNGRIPWIWKMYPFDETEELIFQRIPYWKGVRRNGRLVSLVGATPGEDEQDAAFISFLDGVPEHLASLLVQAAQDLKFGNAPARLEMMLPKRTTDSESDEIPAVLAARVAGVEVWSNFAPDTYNYELTL